MAAPLLESAAPQATLRTCKPSIPTPRGQTLQKIVLHAAVHHRQQDRVGVPARSRPRRLLRKLSTICQVTSLERPTHHAG